MSRFRLLRPFVASFLIAGSVKAADAPLPSPGDVKELSLYPSKVTLDGGDAAANSS